MWGSKKLHYMTKLLQKMETKDNLKISQSRSINRTNLVTLLALSLAKADRITLEVG